MLTTINLEKYGPIISDKKVGEEIFSLIISEINLNNEVIIDLDGIISMATFCAKQIFGKLYVALGSEKFFSIIKIKNANSDIKMIINMGINSALEESSGE